MAFIGGKNGNGVYQRIINEIPPHDVYIEPFAGRAAVFRHKRRANLSILIDSNPSTIDALANESGSSVTLITGDGVEYLRRRLPFRRRRFAYCDPPYVRSSRRDSERDYYMEEWTDEDHERFLRAALDWPGMVLISGYPSALYSRMLANWRCERFTVPTRQGSADECLWANHPKPTELHDYQYLGCSFASRWTIKKKQRSWLRMLAAMPELERRAMLVAINDGFGDGRSQPGLIDPAGEATVSTPIAVRPASSSPVAVGSVDLVSTCSCGCYLNSVPDSVEVSFGTAPLE